MLVGRNYESWFSKEICRNKNQIEKWKIKCKIRHLDSFELLNRDLEMSLNFNHRATVASARQTGRQNHSDQIAKTTIKPHCCTFCLFMLCFTNHIWNHANMLMTFAKHLHGTWTTCASNTPYVFVSVPYPYSYTHEC